MKNNSISTMPKNSLIRQFADATFKKDIDSISNLLDKDGEFQIQRMDMDSIDVNFSNFISWYGQRLIETNIDSINLDQCIHCRLGKSVLLINNGKFPRKIVDDSERSKTGLMVSTRNGKINEIRFCFVFLKTENKYQFEVNSEKIKQLCRDGYSTDEAIQKVLQKSG